MLIAMKNISVVPETLACTYQGEANLYGALVNWLQGGRPMATFLGLSSKQEKLFPFREVFELGEIRSQSCH